MNKKIIIYTILIGLFICNPVNAAFETYINETNIFEDYTKVGDTDDSYVIPHMHFWDTWFCLYNDGDVSYQIYMYDYYGLHPANYTDSFIGTISPQQVITLNSKASYKLYASYNDVSGLTTEKIEKKFNQYWFIGSLLLLILIAGIIIIKKVIK